MKYVLDKINHHTFEVVEKGRLSPRAYAIPHTKKADAVKSDYKRERYESDIVTILSGEWDFRYYSKKSKLPDTLDTARVRFDKVNIPCTWQRTGYEEPVYLNTPYGFDGRVFGLEWGEGVKPPVLPDDFSCGIYRKCTQLGQTFKR